MHLIRALQQYRSSWEQAVGEYVLAVEAGPGFFVDLAARPRQRYEGAYLHVAIFSRWLRVCSLPSVLLRMRGDHVLGHKGQLVDVVSDLARSQKQVRSNIVVRLRAAGTLTECG